jgi:hypothetical protein
MRLYICTYACMHTTTHTRKFTQACTHTQRRVSPPVRVLPQNTLCCRVHGRAARAFKHLCKVSVLGDDSVGAEGARRVAVAVHGELLRLEPLLVAPGVMRVYVCVCVLCKCACVRWLLAAVSRVAHVTYVRHDNVHMYALNHPFITIILSSKKTSQSNKRQ